MSDPTVDQRRVWTDARREQGFRSQAHLDAFYAAFDHAEACPICSKIGGYVPLDDGMQPVMARCPEGARLDRESFR